ncbi:MAG TPA: hypothetical protein VK918_03575 [Pyrinomonadaceae bacterium]|nr:hypothetical protein [Pyrinomonadaceae bacterium]
METTVGDWIGLGVILLLIVGGIFGARALAKPRTRTAEEFERNAAESASLLGASMNALQELMDPADAKAKEVQVQMKDGRFAKKKADGETER